MSGEVELDKCDFCQEIKPIGRNYFFPSKYTKPQFPENTGLYNDGNYAVIIRSCSDCGDPTPERN
jgi:hypothetical protein